MSIYIIAEIGINHNGDVTLAKRLISVAAAAGCDAVKFQKRTVEKVYTKEFLDSPRQSPWGSTQRAQKEGLEFHEDEYAQLDEFCRAAGIEWFASAWDVESQRFLQQFDCTHNKVASAMLTNLPLLEIVAGEGKHTFIGTGMSTWEEIDAAVDIFRKYNCPFELMHCNSIYPMPNEKANLRMIENLRKRYGEKVGYSGHEKGYIPSVCAAALGATSIERHITLSREMYGSDQKASLEPHELCALVKALRETEKVMGTGKRILSEEELSIRKKLRG